VIHRWSGVLAAPLPRPEIGQAAHYAGVYGQPWVYVAVNRIRWPSRSSPSMSTGTAETELLITL
jgi:hypothetical protein